MTGADERSDVIVLGSGGAGCAAAIEAWSLTQRVRILTRGALDDSKTAQAQGGIQAAFGEGDSPEQHYEDTLRTGKNANNPALVRILTSRAKATIQWLESLGVKFDRDGDRYALQTAAGLSAPRVLSAGDTAGKGIAAALIRRVRELGIPCSADTIVEGIQRDAEGFILDARTAGESATLRTRALVLATGSFTPREKASGYADAAKSSTPDGLALAEILGAKVVAPDLVQYHPTGVIEPPALRRIRLPETMRSAGALLKNRHGEIFVDAMLTRGALTEAIAEECRRGNGVATADGRLGVWLDTPQIEASKGSGFIASHYPTFYEMFLAHGHDLSRQPVLVYPILHYSLGGVEIDDTAQTSVSGMFAAGEVAWGVHGVERLMGNSLLDIFVFGRIAGKSAARHAASLRHV